jgi:hypothetical protein
MDLILKMIASQMMLWVLTIPVIVLVRILAAARLMDPIALQITVANLGHH